MTLAGCRGGGVFSGPSFPTIYCGNSVSKCSVNGGKLLVAEVPKPIVSRVSERLYHESTLFLLKVPWCSAVAYINKQGGMRSLSLLNLACYLLVWSRAHFLSLRATYLPGSLIVCTPWDRFGRADVDLYASRENANFCLFFSMLLILVAPGSPR